MLTYALGRELTLADEPAVTEIVNTLTAKKASLRDLIQAIVTSTPFTTT